MLFVFEFQWSGKTSWTLFPELCLFWTLSFQQFTRIRCKWKRKSNICKRLQNIYQSNSANKKNRLCGLSTEDLTTSGTFNGRYTNGGGVGGGCGDGSGGDPVEKEPALPVLASCLLGRLNLLVQLRGFDICKLGSINFDWSPSSSSARGNCSTRRYITNAGSL